MIIEAQRYAQAYEDVLFRGTYRRHPRLSHTWYETELDIAYLRTRAYHSLCGGVESERYSTSTGYRSHLAIRLM